MRGRYRPRLFDRTQRDPVVRGGPVQVELPLAEEPRQVVLIPDQVPPAAEPGPLRLGEQLPVLLGGEVSEETDLCPHVQEAAHGTLEVGVEADSRLLNGSRVDADRDPLEVRGRAGAARVVEVFDAHNGHAVCLTGKIISLPIGFAPVAIRKSAVSLWQPDGRRCDRLVCPRVRDGCRSAPRPCPLGVPTTVSSGRSRRPVQSESMSLRVVIQTQTVWVHTTTESGSTDTTSDIHRDGVSH